MIVYKIAYVDPGLFRGWVWFDYNKNRGCWYSPTTGPLDYGCDSWLQNKSLHDA